MRSGDVVWVAALRMARAELVERDDMFACWAVRFEDQPGIVFPAIPERLMYKTEAEAARACALAALAR